MQKEQIVATHRNGNLHVKIFGDFDTAQATHATSAIARQYRGSENVFIHTTRAGEMLPAGVQAFLACIKRCPVERKKLFLVGKKGLEIAPNGSRVIIPPSPKKSCGTCKKCRCQ